MKQPTLQMIVELANGLRPSNEDWNPGNLMFQPVIWTTAGYLEVALKSLQKHSWSAGKNWKKLVYQVIVVPTLFVFILSSLCKPAHTGARAAGSERSQTDLVQPFAIDKTQRQRNEWGWNKKRICFSEANTGKTGDWKTVCKILKVLASLCKKNLGKRWVGTCRWTVRGQMDHYLEVNHRWGLATSGQALCLKG